MSAERCICAVDGECPEPAAYGTDYCSECLENECHRAPSESSASPEPPGVVVGEREARPNEALAQQLLDFAARIRGPFWKTQHAALVEAADALRSAPTDERRTRDRDLAELRAGLTEWRTRALAASQQPCNEHEIALAEAADREQRLRDDLAVSSRANRLHTAYMKRARQSRDRWRARAMLREAERDAALAGRSVPDEDALTDDRKVQ